MLKPVSAQRWDFKAAAHLLNRAGFGGTPAEIQRLAELGPEKAVASLVDFEKIPDPTPDPDWAKPDPERVQRLAEIRRLPEEERRMMQRDEQQLQRQRLMELRGWWFKRMAEGPRPLQEKATSSSRPHCAQCTRAKPLARMPQSRKR